MPSLRQRLQSESPELHAALLRSWEIAQNEWLPAIAPSEGSFNSQPHFSHIEQHLEALLGPAAESAATKLQLTGLEVYLLLAGVLFHDLGRVHGEADHAFASARDLQDHFAALGIPNFELASSLARIARYHDPRKNVDGEAGGAGAERVKRTLRDIRLEPYGVARELYVATLLALADHMDGSYRRALPRYVAPDDVVGFKGAFRRLVSGTGYDPATCTLKTCLNGFAEASDRKPGAFAYGKTYRHFQRALHTPPDFHWGPIPKVDRQPAKGGKPCDLWRELLRICCPDLTGSAPSRMFRRSLAAATTRAFILRRTPGGAGKAGAPAGQAIWPADYLLARVLNDLRVNREFLKTVQEDLRETGYRSTIGLSNSIPKSMMPAGRGIPSRCCRPSFSSRSRGKRGT
jgi:hypothetical protein